MLSVEIQPDGGVRIAGSESDLRTLAWWLLEAAEHGDAAPSFVADEALTAVEIVREAESEAC